MLMKSANCSVGEHGRCKSATCGCWCHHQQIPAPAPQPGPKQKEMWAILHVPSGIWDHGYTNETLYWSEHEARLACRHEAFKPIRVFVVVAQADPE